MYPMFRAISIGCVLAAVTAALYLPVRDFQFLMYDDVEYVENNSHVNQGLTRESVRWALTSTEASNWHPVTWLSHMLDVELFGISAGKHHLVNVAIHAFNALLLLVVLQRMTGSTWRSAFVAALFALHPLAVESVAWIAERKNVLSTTFWLLVMLTYAGYANRRTFFRYAILFVLFGLGLMTKSMLVTLPCVLLLMDIWPLNRVRREPLGRLVFEKIPLFALVIAASAVTMLSQQQGRAIHSAAELTFDIRAANAAVACMRYIGKMFWPADLIVFYPFPHEFAPGRWSPWIVIASLSGILMICLIALLLARRQRYRYAIVGWLWFLGTLVPASGLFVQFGSQSMADRYTYVPLIGLYIVLVWGAAHLIRSRRALAVIGLAVVVALAACTHRQLPHWRDSESLFRRVVDVEPDNWLGNYSLAVHYEREGDLPMSFAYCERLLRVPPFGRHTRKVAYDVIGRLSRHPLGIETIRRAAEQRPHDARVQMHYGIVLGLTNQPLEALRYLERSLQLDPNNAQTAAACGHVLADLKQFPAAAAAYRDALRIDPVDPDAHFGLAQVLMRAGQVAEARHHAQQAVAYDPTLADKLPPELR